MSEIEQRISEAVSEEMSSGLEAIAYAISKATRSKHMPGTDGSYEVNLVQVLGEIANALHRIADKLEKMSPEEDA